ncbi:cell division suppressor protein YneA [Bacillus atrophaeus]|uniref:cell division suppressor protein YneA n=1 Tax=Bacillus atrophaeus TaxID=1452 RepID=UPI00032ED1A0|nr:cell division suppressor protein YneA [Bacillus atrophaeus]AKL84634.1 YneA [Bacillus atrophaeus UCMB-5137]MBU5261436.1 cell division suppressor protein YneA [Bacillus atrophaeus]MCY8914350.1 cell division suppressor protein YneA [Bacillus atrophaeus]MCY9114572.1 cell division suppressor protein YneA [Bacillus atrophaeus]MDQ0927913.1 LysM repeat protein [Bacillus atrophaeus]
MIKEFIIFVGLFTGVLSAVILLLSFTNNDQEQNQYVKIEVQSGDTLWSLADQVSDTKKINKKDFIEWVTEENNLQTSDIQAGDVLTLPLKKEHPAAYQLATVK